MIIKISIIINFAVLCTADYYTINNFDLLSKNNEICESCENSPFKPTWDSLDNRKLPQWYDDAKFGIFIHWGVFSVPSFGSEWFWKNWKDENGTGKISDFMRQRYPPNYSYQDFARDFTADFFNATQWAELFESAGAKYVVLTSKHHEGFTLWPSKYSFSWNAKDVGPHRDLIGELATAIRNTKIKFGLYHSLYEWFNPLWESDKRSNFSTSEFVNYKIIPEMLELVNAYHPEVLWSDGEWEAPDTYWKSKEFLAWLFNDSPVKDTVVVNDRWGHETLCHHGDFYTCQDRYNPGVLQKHKWENAMTIDKKSWGYRRNADLSQYLTTAELIKELVITVSCGGNLLMNVGPTKDGIIPPIYEERLRDIGQWLKINGEAIYYTRPFDFQNDTISKDVWYTQRNSNTRTIYATVLTWPSNDSLSLAVHSASNVTILGYEGPLKWELSKGGLKISMPPAAHRGQPAWVLKIIS
ncbi:alpha-L-fucosidase [Microplitis mediator]|uniref:alpha-L-fucosidase n=1 Tax=Microplitis mediator TaxID=375433 RepID=UPI0025546956|nr:alpha-L-fucosidase [Microplitis mediator]